MTTEKIYGPWIKWNGGECPVPRDLNVMVKLRNGSVRGPGRAVSYQWGYHGDDDDGDIMEYRIAIEHADLDAAEQLLRANDYTITPPAKPLTFEDLWIEGGRAVTTRRACCSGYFNKWCRGGGV